MATLHGALVTLRPATMADVPELARIRRTPEVRRHWRGGDDMVAEVEKDFEGTWHDSLLMDLLADELVE